MIALLALLAVAAPEPLDAPASDLAERVIARLGVRFDPVLGEGAGAQLLGGLGALGTRGLLYDHLNSYALAQLSLETSGATDGLPSIAQRFPDGRALLLHLAYAELDGLGDEGLLARLHLRAGRQSHLGAALVSFDGATVGYDAGWLSVALRGGQRSAAFDRSDRGATPGLVLGGDARVELGPLAVSAELLHLSRTLGALEGELSVSLATLELAIAPLDALSLALRARMLLPDPSHVELDASWTFDRTLLTLDLDAKLGPDLAYDLAGGAGVRLGDRRSTHERIHLGLPDAQPYLDARASLLFDALDALELAPYLGGRAVLTDAAARSPFDADRLSFGLFASAALAAFELYGDYSAFFYLRPDGGRFDDAAAGGESMVHDLTLGARYVLHGEHAMGPVDGRLLSKRALSAGVYGYLSAARYAGRALSLPLDELSAGGGVELRYDPHASLGLLLGYELARGSPTFADTPGLLHRLRLGLEGRL